MMDLQTLLNNRLILTVCIVLILILESRACFIRNCPPGGKRSMDIVNRPTHQCLPCGPALQGQCVGPKTCCGDFGCLMGTEETKACDKEDDSSEPCSVKGESCGRNGQGNCVATGICCNADACSHNSKCGSSSGKSSNAGILSLLNRLLESQDYTD